MPGINPPNDNLLPHYIAQINNRLRAVETQQQMILSNLKGQPIMALGLQPGSNPAEWGLGLLRQTFRGRAAFFGESSTGATAVKFYAADGSTVLIEVNDAGLTGYAADGTTPLVALTDTGLTQYDSTGHTRVQMGELPDGDYGLQVTDPTTGVKTEFLPVYETQIETTLTVTSPLTAWSTHGGPSVKATVGASGKSLITLGGWCSTGGGVTGRGAFIGCGVDGGSPPSGAGQPNPGVVLSGTTPGGIGMMTGLSFILTTTPGEHTFTVWYFAQKKGARFSSRFLQVRPL